MHVAERIRYLQTTKLKYRAEKNLPGKWSLVSENDPRATKPQKLKKKQFEFYPDHTFAYSENGKKLKSDTFLITIGNRRSPGLVFQNWEPKVWPKSLHYWSDFQLNGDTLVFKSEDCSDCEWSVYARVK